MENRASFFSKMLVHDRVRAATSPAINQRIDEKTEENLRYFSVQPADSISQRILELDQEWDVERLLETNAAALGIAGLALGIGGRKWLLLPAAVFSFLLIHAVKGWCPPVPVLRRMGVRTRREIDAEKYALKYLRGDFEQLKEIYETTIKAVEAYRACMK